MNELEKCLEYCKEQNGLPYCKNCGLSQEIIDRVLKTLRRSVKDHPLLAKEDK